MKLRMHERPGGAVAVVTLSRRNLLALLHKLEMPGSARTLTTDYACPEGWSLIVRSESDGEHYGSRSEPPGPLHPASELFVHLTSGTEHESSEQPDCEDEEQDNYPDPDSDLNAQHYGAGDASGECTEQRDKQPSERWHKRVGS